MRQREADVPQTPAGLSFRFDGPGKITIARPDGFDGGAIYEFVYQAKDPKVMGLGLAATRDIVSFLRHEARMRHGTPNVLAGRIDRAIAFGASQSGRYLHDFLYFGFNTDEAGRTVFDGLMPHLAGGKRTFTNFRFSPARPLLLSACRHAVSRRGISVHLSGDDGRADREDATACWRAASRAGNCPKIIKTDTELEFYQGRAALVATTRRQCAHDAGQCRTFLLSNLQHAAPLNAKSEMTPPARIRPTRSMPDRPYARCSSMKDWIAKGVLPPASRYPSRADGTLVEPRRRGRIPGNPWRHSYRPHQRAAVLDESAMPPTRGKAAYPVFVPKTDADGRDVAGLHLPTLEAPVATHMGWNLRKAGFGEGELCDNTGSMLPFAKTREERLKTGDPRLSLQERYRGKRSRRGLSKAPP